MAREAWEDRSFQVFTDEDGVLRSGYYPTGEGTVTGNVAVDFAWGNIPMQPNDDRSDQGTEIGGGEGDYGWNSTFVYTSDTLNTGTYSVSFNNVDGVSIVGTNHNIASTGWSNFPGFIPDYEGDGDTGAETVVPNVVGLSKTKAEETLTAASLTWTYNTVIPTVTAAVASGATVTLTVDSSYNLKKGDPVWVDSLVVGETPYGLGSVTVKSVTATTVSFANAGEWTFDDVATGEIWGTSNNSVRIIAQDIAAGDIVDAETEVVLDVLYID